MEYGRSLESESHLSLQEQAERIGADAKSFFGFRAPLIIEGKENDIDEWRAQVGERPSDPYLEGTDSIRVTLFDARSSERRQEFRSLLPFVMRHELAHVVPVPRGIEYTSFAGRDALTLPKSKALRVRDLTQARREVIADILAFRSLQDEGPPTMSEVLSGYLRIMNRFDRLHPLKQTPSREILRGQAVLSSLVQRNLFSLEQLRWLEMWQKRADELIVSNVKSGDRDLYQIARGYADRTAEAAWSMDMRPKVTKEEIEPPPAVEDVSA